MKKVSLARKSLLTKGKKLKASINNSQIVHSDSIEDDGSKIEEEKIIPNQSANLIFNFAAKEVTSEGSASSQDEISSPKEEIKVSHDKNNQKNESFEEDKNENSISNIEYIENENLPIPPNENQQMIPPKTEIISEEPNGRIEINEIDYQKISEEPNSHIEINEIDYQERHEEPNGHIEKNEINYQESTDQSVLEIIDGLFTLISDYANNKNTSQEVSRIIKEKAIEMNSKVPETHNLKAPILKFLSTMFCCSCQKNRPELFLNCSHGYCSECAKVFIPSNIFLLKEEIPKCLICDQYLTENDLKLILGPLWSKISPKCIDCGNDHFFSSDRCKHYCKDCLSLHLRAGWTMCKFCEVPYNIEILQNVKSKCKGCGNWVYDVGDYLISVCGQDYHPLCFICSEKSLQTKKCFHCEAELEDGAIAKLEFVLFTICIQCKKTYERGYFTMKTCCSDDICILCQMSNQENCVSCKNPLSSRCKEMMKLVKTIKQN